LADTGRDRVERKTCVRIRRYNHEFKIVIVDGDPKTVKQLQPGSLTAECDMRNARLALMILCGIGAVSEAQRTAYAQHDGHGATLYVAAIEGQQVVPPVATEATGTGAFTLQGSGNRLSLRYDITYQGLAAPPTRIVLRNFGTGGVGEVVHVVCGGQAAACPQQPGATLNAEWNDRATPPINAALAREVVVGRVYVEIEGERGQGLARGQIVTYGSMLPVQGFVTRLRPIGTAAGPDAPSGTGAFYLAQTRDGSEIMAYHLTAAKTDGAPTKALIVSSDASGTPPGAQASPLVEAVPQRVSPRLAPDQPAGTRGQRGGTIAGTVAAPPTRGAGAADLRALASRPQGLNVIVTTDANPAGELVGELVPAE
jgi:CHRD domain